MKQSDPQLKLRLPPALMEKLRSAAEEARRPISSEIAERLEKTFAKGNLTFINKIKLNEGQDKRITTLEERVAELTDLCLKLSNRIDDAVFTRQKKGG
jgi:hypothetical protein